MLSLCTGCPILQACAAGGTLADRGGAASTLDDFRGCSLWSFMHTLLQATLGKGVPSLVQARGGEASVLPGTEGDGRGTPKQTADAGSSAGHAADAGGTAACCKASDSPAAALSLGVDGSHASPLQAQLEAQQRALAAARAAADAQLQQVGSSISAADCSPPSESLSACCLCCSLEC